MATTTLTEARQLLSDMVGDLVTHTASSNGGASGATLIDTSLKDEFGNEDDACNNQWVILTSGAAALLGNERRVLDFAAAGTITPYTAFGAPTQVPSGTTYEIHKIWKPSDKRRALNWALRRAYPAISRNIVDDQITTVTNTWAYRLGDYGTSTATGSTSLTDTGKAWITNQFAGYRVESGANSTTISSNTATVLTVATWAPGTPSSTSAYTIIHPIHELYDVEYELSTTTATYPYVSIPYELREHEGTVTIQFGEAHRGGHLGGSRSWGRLPPPDRTLRLRGHGFLTDFTSTETSVTEVEEHHLDGILFLAAHFLFRSTPSLSASQDRDFYREEANRYLAMWEKYKATLATRRFPARLWSPYETGRWYGRRRWEQSIFDTPAVP